jgi:hypothetical protein
VADSMAVSFEVMQVTCPYISTENVFEDRE